MNELTLEKVVETTKKYASECMEKFGELEGFAFCLGTIPPEGDTGVIMIPLEDNREKNIAILSMLMRVIDCTGYVVAAEIWHAEMIKGDERSPSQRPDRREAVMFYSESLETSKLEVYKIDRDERGKYTGLSSTLDYSGPNLAVGGGLVGLVRKNTVH